MGKLMSKMINRAVAPSPRWFVITKKLISTVTNFAIAIMMILGKQSDDRILLIIKLCQSFLMEVIDSIVLSGNGNYESSGESDEPTIDPPEKKTTSDTVNNNHQ